MQFWREEHTTLDRSWDRKENSKHLLSSLNPTMPMPRPRARPRLTRMSTSSASSFRQWNPRIYTFLVAGVVLLFVSISYLQMSLGGASPSHRPHHRTIKLDDPDDHHVEGTFGSDFLPVKRKKDQAVIAEKAQVRKEGKWERREWVRQGEIWKGQGKMPIKDDSDVHGGSEEEESREDGGELGQEGEEVRFDAELGRKGVGVNEYEMDDFEFRDVEKQLNEVTGFAKDGRVFQGEVLDDMDKFVKGQVMEDTDKFGVDDVDEVAEQVDSSTGKSGINMGAAAYRKDQKISEDIANEHVQEQSSLTVQNSRYKGERMNWETEEPLEVQSRIVEVNEVLNRQRRDGRQVNVDKVGTGNRLASRNEGLSQMLDGSIQVDLQREVEKKKSSSYWEHSSGVKTFSTETSGKGGNSNELDFRNSSPIHLDVTDLTNDARRKAEEEEDGMKPMHKLQGFKEFGNALRERYNSDDEPVDENVQQKLEQVLEIEDAFMLDEESSSGRNPSSQKNKKKRHANAFDPVIPENNPMLQDPDTLPGSGMTNSDKAILKSLRAGEYDREPQMTNKHLRGSGQKPSHQGSGHLILPTDYAVTNSSFPTPVREEDKNLDRSVQETGELQELNSRVFPPHLVQENTNLSKDQQSGMAGMNFDGVASKEGEKQNTSAETESSVIESREEDKSDEADETDEADEIDADEDEQDDTLKWGFYPTLSRTLKFSKFLSAFFKQEKCTMRIFMAWTTAPWTYTTRHQRTMETLLHFHSQACIVVFTETIDFEFFDAFVNEGYKIAVVRPNLEELLGHTPAIEFAYIWTEWRNTNLFYIHYTELLRIAALYKYGGVWLDMDMILVKALPTLQNTVASTALKDGEVVLNGAFMAFDKLSPFLKACIEEFTATYDEKLLGWNGAGLLNRVATNTTHAGGNRWLDEPDLLSVQHPFAFFPISLHEVKRYLKAPIDYRGNLEQSLLLDRILNEAYALHLWNAQTVRLVPETGSLVEIILNQNCMRCTDLL